MPRIFRIFDEINKAVTPMGKGGGPTPQNLTAVPQENSVYVSWDSVFGAVNYIVYRSFSPDLATATVIANPVQTNYTDVSVTPGQTYYYWVAASPGPSYPEGDATGPVAATVPEPPPEPPPEVPVEPPPPPEPPPPSEPGFVPGQNLRRISDIVRRRLEEIQKEKAAGRWPPWGYR